MQSKYANNTSFKSGDEHPKWKGGCYDYWHIEARKIMNCPKGFVVHHKDGDYTNNDISNLEIMTQSKHVALHNKERKNKIRPNSRIRLVIEDVLKLKREGLSRKEISEKLDINQRMVKRCLTKKWREQYES